MDGTKISVPESEKPASNGFFAPIKIFVRQKYDKSKNRGKFVLKRFLYTKNTTEEPHRKIGIILRVKKIILEIFFQLHKAANEKIGTRLFRERFRPSIRAPPRSDIEIAEIGGFFQTNSAEAPFSEIVDERFRAPIVIVFSAF